MKLKNLAIALGLALAATSAQAGQFDANGGLPGQQIDLGAFDWGPTSFLALGGNTAITNFLATGGGCGGGSCSFDVLSQAVLIGTLSPTNAVNTPSGLNVNYEITMTVRFTETVTAVVPGANPIATFTAVPGTGFLDIYFDTSKDSNALTGFGFDDGLVIGRASCRERV